MENGCFHVAVINSIIRSTLRERKEFLWLSLPNHSWSLRGLRAGTWGQELKQRSWKSTAYWLVPLLSSLAQDHVPWGETTHSRVDPPTSIMNQENDT